MVKFPYCNALSSALNRGGLNAATNINYNKPCLARRCCPVRRTRLAASNGGSMNNHPLIFDDWSSLAKSDPDAFEQRRRQVIEQFISSVPPGRQQRLRRLQWRIDMERRRCANPMQSCVRLYTMMWDSVYGRHGLLEVLQHGLSGSDMTSTGQSADILSFKRTSNTE